MEGVPPVWGSPQTDPVLKPDTGGRYVDQMGTGHLDRHFKLERVGEKTRILVLVLHVSAPGSVVRQEKSWT